MSFLAPLFLLGAALIALPIWLHRLQTQSSERQPFSSAMLLEATRQQVHVQKRLKYLVLLALRVLLLLLIALAFARPLWTRPPTELGPAPDGTRLVLVDTSASMGRASAFDEALAAARRVIDSAPRGAVLQLLAADDDMHVVTPITQDRSVLTAALAELAPTALHLDYGRAMAAVDRLAEDLPAPVTLHFISDFQDSGMPARFADLVAPRLAAVETHVVGDAAKPNWSVDTFRQTATGISVGITGPAGSETTLSVRLQANGAPAVSRDLSLAGGGSVDFDLPPLEPGDNRLLASIDPGDELAIDNQRYLVVENQPPAPVPILTLNPGGLPVTYLKAALQADPRGAYRVEPSIIGDFDVRTLPRYRWVIVDDAGSISEGLESALASYVGNGGNVLMFAGRRSASLERVPLTGHAVRPASVGGQADSFLGVGQVDTGHPLLAGTEGWYSINVSRSVPVEALADDQVLVRLENDEPFLLEHRLGQGRVVLLAGGLENEWNDLPLRPVFVSFMVEAASYLSGTDRLARSFAAGASLPLDMAGGASGQVVDPDGNTVLSLVDTTRAQQVSLDKPGFYEVYTPEGEYLVAVNPDRRESDLRVAQESTLRQWRQSVGGTAQTTDAEALTLESEPVELWPALLLILALVLLGESVLGNWYLRPGSTT